MISKEEALKLIGSSSKRSHAILTSKIMYSLAKRLGEDEDEWELVGLLHDLDYDTVKRDMTRHGTVTAEILKGKLSEIALHAIQAHDHRTSIKPRGLLDKALKAADSIATLIEDTKARKTPLTTQALKTTLQDGTHSKPWLRNLILTCQNLDIPTDEFLKLGIQQAQSQ